MLLPFLQVYFSISSVSSVPISALFLLQLCPYINSDRLFYQLCQSISSVGLSALSIHQPCPSFSLVRPSALSVLQPCPFISLVRPSALTVHQPCLSKKPCPSVSSVCLYGLYRNLHLEYIERLLSNNRYPIYVNAAHVYSNIRGE